MNLGRDTILSEEIVKSILEDVRSRKLKPGDKLPSEKQMLEIYQVSRGPVREALRTLHIMHVIDVKQGKGATITSLDPGMLTEHLQFVFDLDSSTVFNLFEARRIFEPEIAYLAAVRTTEEEIAEMERTAMQGFHTDIVLHEMIAKAAKNPFLLRFVSSLERLGKMSRNLTSMTPGVPELAHEQHLGLIDAIRKHDADLARERMREHLDFVSDSYRKFIELNKTQELRDA